MSNIFEEGKFKLVLSAMLKNQNNHGLSDKLSGCNIKLKSFGNPYQTRGMRCPWDSEGLDVQIHTSMDKMSLFSQTDIESIQTNSSTIFPDGYVIGEVNIIPSLEEGISIDIPKTTREELKVLTSDINDAINKNEPALVLDRLHTFSTIYLRELCITKSIDIQDEKENKYPLHSLAGSLKKYYKSNNSNISNFSINAISCFISLFDQYNNIRNENSYAHDNEILSNAESVFVLQTISAMLNFIDKVENVL